MEAEAKKEIDITSFDEGPKEIIKYMDYLPEDDEARMTLLMAFVSKATGI